MAKSETAKDQGRLQRTCEISTFFGWSEGGWGAACKSGHISSTAEATGLHLGLLDRSDDQLATGAFRSAKDGL